MLKSICSYGATLMFLASLLLVAPSFAADRSAVSAGVKAVDAAEDRMMNERSRTGSLPHKRLAAEISKAYADTFGRKKLSARLGELSENELGMFFEAAYKAAFYTNSPQLVGELRAVFDEMQVRGYAREAHGEKLYRSYLGARMFADAKTFLMTHPIDSVQPLPDIVDVAGEQHGSTEWVISADGRSLTRQPTSIGKGPFIVVVSSPLCHFSENAARELSQDASLLSKIGGRMKWLDAPANASGFDDVREWNSSYPSLPMTIAHSREEWPKLRYWATPTFYFFRDGQLIKTVTGWPKQGNKENFAAAAKAIGIQ